MDDETELDKAERLVREAEAAVARQKALVEELRQDGHPTLNAEILLQSFEKALESHQNGLAMVKAGQSKS